jgi:hypothetical protein
VLVAQERKPTKKRTTRKVKMSPELQSVVTNKKIQEASERLESPARRSQAWKGLEKFVGEALNKAGFKDAKRRSKLEQLSKATKGEVETDVDVPGFPQIKLDTKYSIRTWDKVDKLFSECNTKYVSLPEDRFAMITQKSGSKLRLVHINLDWFVQLLAKTYLGGARSDDWSCPRCRHQSLQELPAALGQILHHCMTCELQFVTSANK